MFDINLYNTKHHGEDDPGHESLHSDTMEMNNQRRNDENHHHVIFLEERGISNHSVHHLTISKEQDERSNLR